MALNDLLIYTRMQTSRTFKTLTNETRKALHHRLSPSINEIEHYTVRCLIFIENSNNGHSLLWCAYGQKLKIFNTTTWICDPNNLYFPSLITCMCLDAHHKLWIGCIEGQLFVIDTIQRIFGTQLTLIDGIGGCQTMTFDIIRNQMLIANRSSLIIIWNTINKQRLIEINLEEIYKETLNVQQRIFKNETLFKSYRLTEESTITIDSSTNSNELKSIQIYKKFLFACYRDDYILIFRITNSNTYVYEDIVSITNNKNNSMPINSFLVYNEQLWISSSYIIYIFNINHEENNNFYNLIMKKRFDDDHLLTMLGVDGYIWAGSSRGNIYIFQMNDYEIVKTFDGHKDGVCCLCSMLDVYIISGSQICDTSIGVWENIQTNNTIVTH